MRVERKTRTGMQLISQGCYKWGRLGVRVKNNRVVNLHVTERSNEDATVDVYERSEIKVSGIC